MKGTKKDVSARVLKYMMEHADTVLWREPLAAALGLTGSQIRNACYALAKQGHIVVVKGAHAWKYPRPVLHTNPIAAANPDPFKAVMETQLTESGKRTAHVKAAPVEFTGGKFENFGPMMFPRARLGDGRLVLESSTGDLWIARKLDLGKDPI